MRPVVLWGATGQARVLRELLGHLDYAVIAIFDSRSLESPFPDVPIYHGRPGFLQWKAAYSSKALPAFCVAIGGDHGGDRRELRDWLEQQGLESITAVHPRAFVADDAELGLGTQVLAMAAVGAGTRVGRASLINTSASVDHDCQLGHGVHVGPGARLAGEVIVGDEAFIGTGAVILPRRHIGPGAIVGAGAVVTRDVPANTVVIGNPARALAQN